MWGRLLNLPTLSRSVSFAMVAIAAVAATLHLREQPSRVLDHAAPTDGLSDELKRCQVLAAQARDDAACKATWSENRRRFFTDRPAPSPTTSSVPPANSPQR